MYKLYSRLALASCILIAAAGCARTADSVVQQPTLPDSPDGTVVAVAEALQDNHAEILWIALPESYQNDITEITHEFAGKMDPAIYDRAFALVIRAIEVLDDRKDVILGSETFKSTGADAEDIRTGLNSAQMFTQALKSSEVATLGGLGSIDWGQFLATTGSEILENAAALETEGGDSPLDELESLTVETLEISDDRATLRISSAEHEPEDVEMVRVEGRWIPAEMADEWPEFVQDAREGLAEMTPENMAAQETQIMMVFGMADGFIEQVASLQTPEEFDAAIGPMLAPLMGGEMDFDDDEEWETEEGAPEEG
jgi:hypothetical protein